MGRAPYAPAALLLLLSTLCTGCNAVRVEPLTPEGIALILTLFVVAWYTIETARLRRIEQARFDQEREFSRNQLDASFKTTDRVETLELSHSRAFKVELVNTGGPLYEVSIVSAEGEVSLDRAELWMPNHPGWITIQPHKPGPKLTRFTFTLAYENERKEPRTKRFTYSRSGGATSVVGWYPSR